MLDPNLLWLLIIPAAVCAMIFGFGGDDDYALGNVVVLCLLFFLSGLMIGMVLTPHLRWHS